MDHRLRQLEQQVRALPSDAGTRARLRAELYRLAALDDVAAWARAQPAAQDLVLAAVGRLLGPDFEELGAAEHAAAGLSHRVGAFRHVKTGVLLHLVPGGDLLMGSLRGREDERPRHRVRVPPLLVGRYPVLQAEWDRVGGEDVRGFVGPDLPIVGITWTEARGWVDRAGGGLRLPSEAEWEYACRAGTQTEYFWGDEPDAAYCWFGGGEGWSIHAPADHDARANAFGLVDTSGNVSEWCEDFYGPYVADDSRDAAPRRRGALRVFRGGDAFNRASFCRAAYRNYAQPDASGLIGLRVARSLPF